LGQHNRCKDRQKYREANQELSHSRHYVVKMAFAQRESAHKTSVGVGVIIDRARILTMPKSDYCSTQFFVNVIIGPRKDPRPLRPNRIKVLEGFMGSDAIFRQYDAHVERGEAMYSSTFDA
jgi:hypothetical protein